MLMLGGIIRKVHNDAAINLDCRDLRRPPLPLRIFSRHLALRVDKVREGEPPGADLRAPPCGPTSVLQTEPNDQTETAATPLVVGSPLILNLNMCLFRVTKIKDTAHSPHGLCMRSGIPVLHPYHDVVPDLYLCSLLCKPWSKELPAKRR